MVAISCPLCGFKTGNDYEIRYHIEVHHSEGESPFVVSDPGKDVTHDQTNGARHDFNAMDEEEYVMCPINGCGEAIHLAKIDDHIDIHRATGIDEEATWYDDGRQLKRIKVDDSSPSTELESRIAPALHKLGDHQDLSTLPDSAAIRAVVNRQISRVSLPKRNSSTSLRDRSSYRRLGTSELGPHANEKQMPAWLWKLLERDGETVTVNHLDHSGRITKFKVVENQAVGVLPVIQQLLQQDPATEYAYTCHPTVCHISKMKNEGGFCGYRNIQMMTSYINGAESEGHYHFNAKVPTIFEIQEFIEHAWDLGINKQGRIETGGIRGTRKYIGTSEAQAMFCSLDIACVAQGLRGKSGLRADQLLFQCVEQYFRAGCTFSGEKVRRTELAPIYFQHPGHSLTIIGFEKKRDGGMNLIVFDPISRDPPSITRLINRTFSHKTPGDLLRDYRRGTKYLRKYKEFEILELTSTANKVTKEALDHK